MPLIAVFVYRRWYQWRLYGGKRHMDRRTAHLDRDFFTIIVFHVYY